MFGRGGASGDDGAAPRRSPRGSRADEVAASLARRGFPVFGVDQAVWFVRDDQDDHSGRRSRRAGVVIARRVSNLMALKTVRSSLPAAKRRVLERDLAREAGLFVAGPRGDRLDFDWTVQERARATP
mmetsp:Transcript_3424/g.10594  ORF Transcript_3424/g.10594 Transcript_3424/m.10594 type:complete len:127 (-) Transcript_3424:66-446(-)